MSVQQWFVRIVCQSGKENPSPLCPRKLCVSHPPQSLALKPGCTCDTDVFPGTLGEGALLWTPPFPVGALLQTSVSHSSHVATTHWKPSPCSLPRRVGLGGKGHRVRRRSSALRVGQALMSQLLSEWPLWAPAKDKREI